MHCKHILDKVENTYGSANYHAKLFLYLYQKNINFQRSHKETVENQDLCD